MVIVLVDIRVKVREWMESYVPLRLLGATGVGTVCHYVLYCVARPWTGKGVADRMLWASVSLALAVVWTWAFWGVITVGRIGIELVDIAMENRQIAGPWTFQEVLGMFIGSFPVFGLYFWVTGMTSDSRSSGFLARKFFPSAVIGMLALKHWGNLSSVPPSTIISISAWLLRLIWVDALVDMCQFFAVIEGTAAKTFSRLLHAASCPAWMLVCLYEFLFMYVNPRRVGIVWIALPLALSLYVVNTDVNPLSEVAAPKKKQQQDQRQ